MTAIYIFKGNVLGAKADNVPWLPRVASISTPTNTTPTVPTPTVPRLIPIAQRTRPVLLSGLERALLEAQIKVNTQMMEELEALKEEKKQFLAKQDKMEKDNQFLSVKYTRATEQLLYLKKKVDKRDGGGKENKDPAKSNGNKSDGSNQANENDDDGQSNENQNQKN